MADPAPLPQRIAKHFISNSPPGQAPLLWKELQLLTNDQVSEQVAAELVREHLEAVLFPVQTPSGQAAVVCSQARVASEEGVYLYRAGGEVFELKPLLGTACAPSSPASAADEDTDSSLAELRGALTKAAEKYIANAHSQAEQSACAAFFDAPSGGLVLHVSALHTNLRSFYAGSWRSTWKVSVAGGKVTVTGRVDVHAHYFEDGNVQMQQGKDFPAQEITADGAEAQAAAIIKHVTTTENSLYSSVDSVLTDIGHSALKAMRRPLPVTRERFDWNASKHRLVAQLQAA